MVSSSRPAVACILLIFGAAVYSHAQTNPAKPPTASIGGKVTIKGKGVSGLTVVALGLNERGRGNNPRYRAITDSSGKYRIANLPEGNYQVNPYAPAYVVEKERATLMLAEGETVEDLNFALTPGGVITGKITDSEGRPVIEEPVHITRASGESEDTRFYRGWIQTDDRGIYRVFGLRAGQYKVSAGQSEYGVRGARHSYRHTFHPSTTEPAKAMVIDVAVGTEVRNVDIVMADGGATGFKVAGRIIDGESGKPLSNIVYGLTHKHESGSSSMMGLRSNSDGEFKFENVLPGKYAVFIQHQPASEVRANPVAFEVTDRDITGLTIKTARAASLSGIIVFEGVGENPLIARRRELSVHAYVENSEPDDHHSPTPPMLNPDGTFKIGGLRGGTARIVLASMNHSHSEFAVIRVERDGVPLPNNSINLKDGEQVQGLRVIVNQLTGAIRGQVKIEDGELPSSAWLSINVTFLDDNASIQSSRSEQVDSRGLFHVDALKAGTYEVQASVFLRGPHPRVFQSKKQVTVADNAVTEVVLTVKLKSDP